MITFTEGKVMQRLNVDASCFLSSYRCSLPFGNFFPFLATTTILLLDLVFMIESVLGLADLLLGFAFFKEVITELADCHDMVFLP